MPLAMSAVVLLQDLMSHAETSVCRQHDQGLSCEVPNKGRQTSPFADRQQRQLQARSCLCSDLPLKLSCWCQMARSITLGASFATTLLARYTIRPTKPECTPLTLAHHNTLLAYVLT